MVAQNIYRYLWVIQHNESKSSKKPLPKQVFIIISLPDQTQPQNQGKS